MASTKTPKKPAAPKLPRKPKASASAAVCERYLKRVNDIKKKHQAKMSDWKKKVSSIEKEKSDRKRLHDKISKITSASLTSGGRITATRRRKSSSSPKRKTTAKRRTGAKVVRIKRRRRAA